MAEKDLDHFDLPDGVLTKGGCKQTIAWGSIIRALSDSPDGL